MSENVKLCFKGRKTAFNVLFDICINRFVLEGWKLKKILVAKTGKGKTLAQTFYDTKTVNIHPIIIGEADPPLAENLLHELLHVGLSTDDDTGASEEQVEWLEKQMWRHISQDRKDYLVSMIEHD